MSGAQLYDTIGATYTVTRRTEPRIAAQVWAALGDARTVLNVGAGTGSYEPAGLDVTAVEPSAVMRAQRPAGAAPCVDATAESLPFEDQSFDAAMAFATIDHWQDPIAGLREMRRVARRVVVLTCDDSDLDRFWLNRDYLPEYAGLWAGRPSLAELARAITARTEPVPIPWDCSDGFYEAYWRLARPTWTSKCAAECRSGPASGRTPSSARCAACVMTSHPAAGRSATATSPASTRQSFALSCLSPELATSQGQRDAENYGRRPRRRRQHHCGERSRRERGAQMIDQARVAVIGVGNNISALVQGIALYRATGSLAGIRTPVLDGLGVGDIDFVAAFATSPEKIGTGPHRGDLLAAQQLPAAHGRAAAVGRHGAPRSHRRRRGGTGGRRPFRG